MSNLDLRAVDVNTEFANERGRQLADVEARNADIDRRIADGRLQPLSGGQYLVNDPGSSDNGEVWRRQTDGQILPQHGLDTSLGRAALYTAVPAWHRLGTVIPGGTTDIHEVLALGGIDFQVHRRPVEFRADGVQPLQVLRDQFVTVRNDTGAASGSVAGRIVLFLGNRATAAVRSSQRKSVPTRCSTKIS